MDLYYSLDFPNNPRVAIVPNPDSYDLAYKYIGAAEEGVLMWTSQLSDRYGGDWDVQFEVVTNDKTLFSSEPDIIVNLVTPEQESYCERDFYGVTYISSKPVKPIQVNLCVVFGDRVLSTNDVSATAAHEFIHAVGLGHTWNVQGDLMCSKEKVGQSWQYTCPASLFGQSKVPSELNIAAVAMLYGEDGFVNPNSDVDFKSKYWIGQDNDEPAASVDEPASIEPTDEDVSSYFTPMDTDEQFPTEPTTSQPKFDNDNSGVVHVASSMTNGYIAGYQVETSATSLKMSVETSDVAGRLTVTLPRYLIDSKSTNGNNDEDFIVLIDGEPASFRQTRWDSEQRTLVIDVPANASDLEIVGSEVASVVVVPEFPIVIPIVASAIALVILA